MGRKSRHYRDESDPLLVFYSATLGDSTRNANNALYSSIRVPLQSPASDKTIGNGQGANDTSNNPTTPSKSNGGRNSVSPLALFRSTSQSQSQTDLNSSQQKYRVHRVSYTAQNHIQVLFRMHGSAFPNVLPFCVANVAWMCAVAYLKEHDQLDLTFHSSIGHSFMGLLVSFLIVNRAKISYDRFMDYRRNLATCYRSCRELAQHATVYTYENQTPQAKEWRQEVCYRTILLLRVTMDALLWSSTERDTWEEEYFNLSQDTADIESVSDHFLRFRKLSHGRRSRIDENMRAPITLNHVLKQTIMTHPHYLGCKMAVNEYRDLLMFTQQFQQAFHEFRVLIFTPYPFPLVQMTRACVFFWVYTLPLVLLKEYRLWSSLLIVLLVSFGFMGIEYVSIALDDPFGDDTNDVDEHGMALLVYEDIYLSIYRTDGPASAVQLRERVLSRYKQGRGLDCYRDDLKGYDIWEPPAHLQENLQFPNDDEGSIPSPTTAIPDLMDPPPIFSSKHRVNGSDKNV
ncbi:Bestrophin, RFP-TM, chloride channel [Seminavis robusta]|uniref:Bestrophin, RFP-TM, chloride channel n=1 Tax=Seminavis robusta TaxID=568900 RepID=A0A9N8DBZ7_9STRA|nr:Bestrophin, RFP-TM, chloride channel [Seminavis robusta]|eukprot:Sro28_g018840.1 Bestrophin, RFP-TM, chloride channel (514) ;mRNA; r:136310-138030